MSYANTATKNIYFDDENNEADDTYDAVDASDDVGDDGDDKNAASQLRLSLENKNTRDDRVSCQYSPDDSKGMMVTESTR